MQGLLDLVWRCELRGPGVGVWSFWDFFWEGPGGPMNLLRGESEDGVGTEASGTVTGEGKNWQESTSTRLGHNCDLYCLGIGINSE